MAAKPVAVAGCLPAPLALTAASAFLYLPLRTAGGGHDHFLRAGRAGWLHVDADAGGPNAWLVLSSQHLYLLCAGSLMSMLMQARLLGGCLPAFVPAWWLPACAPAWWLPACLLPGLQLLRCSAAFVIPAPTPEAACPAPHLIFQVGQGPVEQQPRHHRCDRAGLAGSAGHAGRFLRGVWAFALV